MSLYAAKSVFKYLKQNQTAYTLCLQQHTVSCFARSAAREAQNDSDSRQ